MGERVPVAHRERNSKEVSQMKIYVENRKEFYDLSHIRFESTEKCLAEGKIDFSEQDANKTTQRDFEIGARVYFEGVGWTEVVEIVRTKRNCYTMCAVTHGCNSGRMRCGSKWVRKDKKTVYFKELESAENTKPEKTKGDFFDTMPAPEVDPINHPAHYTGKNGVECIQVTEQFNFNRGNAIKYIWRAGEKDKAREVEDLKKAIWYIEREITRIEKEGK